MIPAPFDYHRPKTLSEAISLLATHRDEARVVAGGHSLIPMMKLRMAQPEHLVDLQDLGELRGIREEGGALVIGAMTRQRDLVASELLASRCPIIRETALLIADPQVRYCGTLGGNVANGDPGNDMPAVMMALDAAFVLRGPNGERRVPARTFYEASFVTALGATEIMTAIVIKAPPAGHGWAYEKQKRKVGDYATAAAAVILTVSSGTCTAASIALTNVAATPLFAAAAGAALIGTRLDAAAIGAAVRAARAVTSPSPDGRGPAEFRSYVAGVMVQRAIERAKARA